MDADPLSFFLLLCNIKQPLYLNISWEPSWANSPTPSYIYHLTMGLKPGVCLIVLQFVTMTSLSVTYLPRWHHPRPAKWDKKVPKREKPAGPSGGFNLYQGERGAIKRTASLEGNRRSRVCCLEFTSRQNVNRLCACVFMTCLN